VLLSLLAASCSLEDSESGYARAASGILSLSPQTESFDGPRTYPYQVGRDYVGSITLQLTFPDGQVAIFYAS
jgi:hypothetical protein